MYLRISLSNIILYIIYILILSNILDVYYTYLLISRGYQELNPVANYIINTIGYLGLLLLKLIPLSILYYHRYTRIIQENILVLYILTGVFVVINYIQLTGIIL